MFSKIPDDCDIVSAIEKRIIIYSCPFCGQEIELSEENRYHFICKCGYDWTPGLFGYNANVSIKKLINLKYGIWKDYKE